MSILLSTITWGRSASGTPAMCASPEYARSSSEMTSRSLQRVAVGLERRGVEHVRDDRAALDVAQEVVAKPLALRGAGDEPRHVGHREAGGARRDDAEVGHERREGVVGDLGAHRAHRRDDRRLARAGVAHERDVGDRLELEDDGRLFAWLAQAARIRAPCA